MTPSESRPLSCASFVSERFSDFTGAFIFTFSVLLMAGWVFDVALLDKNFLPFASIRPNIGVGFIAGSFSLISMGRGKLLTLLSFSGAFLTMIVGVLTLTQYIFGVDLEIDQVLFAKPQLSVEGNHPARMSISSALGLSLLGVGLLLSQSKKRVWLAQLVAGALALLGFFSLISNFYGTIMKFGLPDHTPMSAMTSFFFLIMAMGVFVRHPEEGFASLLTSKTLGGWVFRRLAPVVAIAPILFGWIQLRGEGSHIYDSAFRIAVMMVALTLVLVLALWWGALALNRLDEARQRAEKMRGEAEESYHDQFMRSSVIMFMLDAETGDIVDANRAALAFYGYSREKMLTLNIADINTLPPKKLKDIMSSVKEGKGGRFAFKHRLADGGIRDILVSSSRVMFGEREVLHSIVHDVTAHKAAQEALRKSEEEHRLLIENSVSGIASHQIILDELGKPVDYVFLSANEAFEKQTGLPVSSVIGRRVTEILPGIEETLFIDIYGKVALSGNPIRFEHYAPQLKKFFSISAYSLGEGRFATVFDDISERRIAEERLKEREGFFNLLLETIPIPVFSKDREGRFILINKAFETLFWKSREEILGKTLIEFSSPEMIVPEAVEEGPLFEKPCSVAYYSKCLDGLGTVHDLIVRKASCVDRKGKIIGTIGAVLDITDQKRLEEELRETERQLDQVSERAARRARKKKDSLPKSA